jgi:hypothetical protein
MKHFSWFRLLPVVVVSVFLLASGCGRQESKPANASNSNSPQQADKKGGLPADAKPMGQAAPGYYTAGPNGNVSLRFTAPQDRQVTSGNSVAPTFNITGYPIYKDEERNKGQHIHVILDNEPYEADHDPNKPFSPESGLFDNLKPGTHTLRAFPSREWHESIKQTDGAAFDMVVFQVKEKSPGPEINKSAPLLTYSRPKGEYRWKDDPRGILLDYYITNATISGSEYRVRYTVNGKNPKILTRWEPVWWPWEQLAPGAHKVLVELLDKDNKPVPFKVGSTDYNRTERTFKILGEGEQPSEQGRSSNANSNRSH